MKTSKQFHEFFHSRLVPKLRVLDKDRKQVHRKLLIWEPVAILGGFLLALLLTAIVARLDWEFLVYGPLAAGAIAYGIITAKYRGDFKRVIIRRIVNFVDSNLRYKPDYHVGLGLFRKSRLFAKEMGSYTGEDYISGRLGKTFIEFSEVSAWDVREERLIFRGLFFVADFHKEFAGRTFVLPDYAERQYGRIGKWAQSLNKAYGELVKMEDPEFERLFVVYSDDQITARYILSTSLMERLVNFREKAHRKFRMSFVDSKLYLAIEISGDLFEPSVKKTIVDYESCRAYFDCLSLMAGVVEDLNLNTRIWTKD